MGNSMKIVLLHNHFDEDYLEEIIEEMKIIGPPIIRAYDLEFEDFYQAVEGCHRLRVCEKIGVTPVIELVNPTETIKSLDLDVDDHGFPDTRICELGDWENYHVLIVDGRILSREEKGEYYDF